MDELDIKGLNKRISMLGRKVFSVSELNILVEDFFLYINNNGSKEELIKNLIEFMVNSIVNGFSSGKLIYDDYVEYVGNFKKIFSQFSGFSDDAVKEYFNKYGLNDEFISFRLYLELLDCNDSLEDIIKIAELEGITALEWIPRSRSIGIFLSKAGRFLFLKKQFIIIIIMCLFLKKQKKEIWNKLFYFRKLWSNTKDF